MKFVVLVVTFFCIVLADPAFLEDEGYNNSDSSGFGIGSSISPPPNWYTDFQFLPPPGYEGAAAGVASGHGIAGGNYDGDAPRNNLMGGTNTKRKQNLIQGDSTQSEAEVYNATALIDECGDVEGGLISALTGGNYADVSSPNLQIALTTHRGSTAQSENNSDSNCSIGTDSSSISIQSYPPGDETNLPKQKLETGYYYPRPITGGDFDDDAARNNLSGETSGRTKQNLIQKDRTQNEDTSQNGSELIKAYGGTREHKKNLSQVGTTQSDSVLKFGGGYYKYNPGSNFGIETGSNNAYKFPSDGEAYSGVNGITRTNADGHIDMGTSIGTAEFVRTIQRESVSNFKSSYYNNNPGLNFRIGTSSSNAYKFPSGGASYSRDRSNGYGIGRNNYGGYIDMGTSTGTADFGRTIQREILSNFKSSYYNNNPGSHFGIRTGSSNAYKYPSGGAAYSGDSSNGYGIAGNNDGGYIDMGTSIGTAEFRRTIQKDSVSNFKSSYYNNAGSPFGIRTGSSNTYKFLPDGEADSRDSSNGYGIAGTNDGGYNDMGTSIGTAEFGRTIQRDSVSNFKSSYYNNNPGSYFGIGTGSSNTYKFPCDGEAYSRDSSNGYGIGRNNYGGYIDMGSSADTGTTQSESVSKFGSQYYNNNAGSNFGIGTGSSKTYKFPRDGEVYSGDSSNGYGIAGNIDGGYNDMGTSIGTAEFGHTIQRESFWKFESSYYNKNPGSNFGTGTGSNNANFPSSSTGYSAVSSSGNYEGVAPSNTLRGETCGERKQNLIELGPNQIGNAPQRGDITQSVTNLESCYYYNFRDLPSGTGRYFGNSDVAEDDYDGETQKINIRTGTSGVRGQNGSKGGRNQINHAPQRGATTQSEGVSKLGSGSDYNNSDSNFSTRTGSSNIPTQTYPPGDETKFPKQETGYYYPRPIASGDFYDDAPSNNLRDETSGRIKQKLIRRDTIRTRGRRANLNQVGSIQSVGVSESGSGYYNNPGSNFGIGTGLSNTYKFDSSGAAYSASSSNGYGIAGTNYGGYIHRATGGERQPNLSQVDIAERGGTTQNENVSKLGSGYYDNSPGSNFGIGTGSNDTNKFVGSAAGSAGHFGIAGGDYDGDTPRNNIRGGSQGGRNQSEGVSKLGSGSDYNNPASNFGIETGSNDTNNDTGASAGNSSGYDIAGDDFDALTTIQGWTVTINNGNSAGYNQMLSLFPDQVILLNSTVFCIKYRNQQEAEQANNIGLSAFSVESGLLDSVRTSKNNINASVSVYPLVSR